MNEYDLVLKRQSQQFEQTFEIRDDSPLPELKNILILEDDDAFAALLKEGLENESYLVTLVQNGAEGLKKVLSADFQIIVCDMVMPNFPGDMFYLAVERARPHLCKRFIFMTGHQGDRKIEQFIRRIRGLMLWKPFELHVLFDAIKAVSSK